MKITCSQVKRFTIALLLPALMLAGCHKDAADNTPAIMGVAPDHGDIGSSVDISGKNLDATTEVYFGKVKATEVTVAGNSHITAKVPAGAVSGKVSIRKNATGYDFSGSFTVTNAWMPRNEGFGGGATCVTGIYFLFNNKIYLGWGLDDAGFMKNFKLFDLATNTWSDGPALPSQIGQRYYLTAVQKDNLVYVGTGMRNNGIPLADFWEFDPAKTGDAACRQLTDLPEGTWGAWSYLQNGTINVSAGVNNRKFYSFDGSANGGQGAWTNPLTTAITYTVTPFVANDHLYYNEKNEYWSQNPLQKIAGLPFTLSWASSCTIGPKAYLLNATGDFAAYNPAADQWTLLPKLPLADIASFRLPMMPSGHGFLTVIPNGQVFEFVPGY